MEANGPPGAGRAPAGEGAPPGGAPPRKWMELKPAERRQAEKDLLAAAAQGGDMRKALASIGISDPESLPDGLTRRLITLAKRKRPSLKESLSTMRPGSGVGPGGS